MYFIFRFIFFGFVKFCYVWDVYLSVVIYLGFKIFFGKLLIDGSFFSIVLENVYIRKYGCFMNWVGSFICV